MRFAAAAAALVVSRLGGIPACATSEEIDMVVEEGLSVSEAIERAKMRADRLILAAQQTHAQHATRAVGHAAVRQPQRLRRHMRQPTLEGR